MGKVRAEVEKKRQYFAGMNYLLAVENRVLFSSPRLGEVLAFKLGLGYGVICSIMNDDQKKKAS